MPRFRPEHIAFLFALVAFCVDRMTKVDALGTIGLNASVSVFSWLAITPALNPGATAGMLGSLEPTMLLALQGACLTGLTFWLAGKIHHVALGLVVGGGFGNFYDRALFGHVIDMIDIMPGQMGWPIFNLADLFLVGGMTLGLLLSAAPRAPTWTR